MACLSNKSLFVSVLAAMLLAFIAACSDRVPPSTPAAINTQANQQAVVSDATPEPPATLEATLAASDCRVGQMLKAEDSCTYPGTSEEFSVDESGTGHFLFFTASAVINAQNARINNQAYEFAARRQDDGSWIIEVVGTPSDSVRVSDLMVSVRYTPTPIAMPARGQAAAAPSPIPTAIGLVDTPAPVSEQAPTPEASPASTSTPVPTPTVEPTPITKPAESPPATVTSTPTPSPPPTTIPPPTSVSTPAPTSTPVPTETPAPTPMPGASQSPQSVAGIPDKTIMVYDSLVIDVAQTFRDSGGEQMSNYRLIIGNPVVAKGRINAITGELTLEALEEGSSWISLTACDAQKCSDLGELMFLLTVEPLPNRPPQAVHAVDDQSVRVGESVSVQVKPAFWDLEGDRIVGYRSRVDDDRIASAVYDSFTGRLRLSGVHQGTTKVEVSACDKNSCGDSQPLIFTLTVKPPANRPPQIVGVIPDHTVKLGDSITINLAPIFKDPDGDKVRAYHFFQSNRDVAHGIINSKTGKLTLRTVEIGTTNVAVNASDGRLRTDRNALSFSLTVTPPTGYLPDAVYRIPDQNIEVGDDAYIQVWRAFDVPDRHRITRYDFLIVNDEIVENAEMLNDGVLVLIGAEEGKSRISARACNALGCSQFSDLEFVLTVTETEEELNRSPEVVGSIGNRTLTLGESETMDVSSAFSDPDQYDAIVDYDYTLSAREVARGSSISDTGILTLRAARVGKTTVSISACDKENKCSDAKDLRFILTVSAPRVAQR